MSSWQTQSTWHYSVRERREKREEEKRGEKEEDREERIPHLKHLINYLNLPSARILSSYLDRNSPSLWCFLLVIFHLLANFLLPRCFLAINPYLSMLYVTVSMRLSPPLLTESHTFESSWWTISEGLRGVSLLEGVCHWAWALSIQMFTPSPVSLCSLAPCLWISKHSATVSVPCLSACCHAPCHVGHRFTIKKKKTYKQAPSMLYKLP